jgi:hypothetical protein
MADLSDINMEGVKPMGDSQELPAGQFLVRIEETDKKQVNKEVFDEAGNKLTPNHYLQVDLKVYGGPNDGQIEFARLNLWNHNATAVNMAKSERKSIEEAIGVVSTNSAAWHGKWMLLEKKPKTKKPDELIRIYTRIEPEMMESLKSIMDSAPALAAKAESAPATAAAPAPAFLQRNVPAAASPSKSDLPAWAQPKKSA